MNIRGSAWTRPANGAPASAVLMRPVAGVLGAAWFGALSFRGSEHALPHHPEGQILIVSGSARRAFLIRLTCCAPVSHIACGDALFPFFQFLGAESPTISWRCEMRCLITGVVGLVLMSLLPCQTLAESLSDHFDDGVIDSNMWVTHGYELGVGGIGSGSWQHSISEGTAMEPGLQERVWGPTSANSYGAEAWVLSKKDLNDGQNWLINFTWGTTVGYTPHCDTFPACQSSQQAILPTPITGLGLHNIAAPTFASYGNTQPTRAPRPTISRIHPSPRKRGR